MNLFTIPLLLFFNLFISIANAEKVSSRRINFGKINNDYSNCVCFPGGQSLIPELSNPAINGMERLVVYLYRTVDTKQIIAFTPNPEKQAIIPNIPFTRGDLVQQVTSKTIASLFNNETPYKSYNQGDPIGWNIGTIENVNSVPKFTDLIQPIWKYPGQSHQTYQQFSHEGSYTSQLQPNYVEVNLPYDKPINPNSWYPSDKKYYVPANPYQSYPEVDIVRPNFSGVFGYNEDQSATSWTKPYSTFDSWFKNQMGTFQDPKLPQTIKAINFNVLKLLVQKTLYENHIQIGADGILTDSTGTPTHLKNLELRPILIGNPVKYKTLKGNQHLTLPQTLPYLEGILITLIDPPKILGVIPLGKTYVSNSQRIRTFNSPSQKYYQALSGLNYSWSFNPVESVPKVMQTKINTLHKVFKDSTISSIWQHRSHGESKEKELSDAIKSDKSLELSKTPKSSKLIQSTKTHKPAEPLKVSQVPQATNGRRALIYDKRLSRSSILADNQDFDSFYVTNPKNTFSPSHNHGNTFSTLNNKADHEFIVSDNNKQYLIVSALNSKAFRPIKGDVSSILNSKDTSFDEPLKGSHYLVVSPIDGNSDKNNLESIANPVNGNRGTSINAKNALLLVPASTANLADFNSNIGTHDLHVIPMNKNVKSESSAAEISAIPVNSKTDSNNEENSNANADWNYDENTNDPVSITRLASTTTPNRKQFDKVISGDDLSIVKSSPEPNSESKKGSITKSEPSASDSKKDRIAISNSNNYGGSQNQNVVLGEIGDLQNDKSDKQTRRFSSPLINGVLKTLIRMVIQNIAGDPPDSPSGRRNGDDDADVSEVNANLNSTNPVEKKGEVEGGDQPDFRIIGGSAATGSGAPLSNKGRSGWFRI